MQYLFENKDKGKTHIKNIMELLVKLKNLIAEKINLKKKNKQCIYLLLNFVKFYHYIIFNKSELIKCIDDNFCNNIITILNLCKQSCLINCSYLFNVIIGGEEYKKTIIDLILEIIVQYIVCGIDNNKNFSSLLNFKELFLNVDTFNDNKQRDLFYINDYLKVLTFKKKKSEEDINIQKKYY
jgi:hypothetical protein